MFCSVDVYCPIDECATQTEYKCEYEDAGDGSEHEVKCAGCGETIYFEIGYDPTASNESMEPPQ